MTRARMVFTKWGGIPHWEYDALHLGEDEHGTWLGLPAGTLVGRPRARFLTDVDQVVLVPESGFVATFFAPGGRAPCDLYVDITTVPSTAVPGTGGLSVSAVDLDLDVLRGWTGRVWIDDEDEFVEHRVCASATRTRSSPTPRVPATRYVGRSSWGTLPSTRAPQGVGWDWWVRR